jgi:hypothetical protein
MTREQILDRACEIRDGWKRDLPKILKEQGCDAALRWSDAAVAEMDSLIAKMQALNGRA